MNESESNSNESLVICPSCETLLKVERQVKTFLCPCGVELQHPVYEEQKTVQQNTASTRAFGEVRKSMKRLKKKFESNASVTAENSCKECRQKFSLLKRKRVCRNCEANVCAGCSVGKWHNQMLPKEKNPKAEKWLRVCATCQQLSEKFRKALLEGEKTECERLLESGTVQIFYPYKIYPDKYFPVHCAVVSGSLEVVKWLITKRCNPRVKCAKGYTALALACRQGHFEIVKFLLFRGLSKVEEVTDVVDLQKILRTSLITLQKQDISLSLHKYAHSDSVETPKRHLIPSTALEEEEQLKIALELSETTETKADIVSVQESAPETADECVICLDNSVSCVLVPCGHICCCYACGAKFKECPVCRRKIDQIVKTYKT